MIATQRSPLACHLGIGIGAAFPRIEFGLLCLFTLVMVAWGVARLRMSSLGSAMLAVRARRLLTSRKAVKIANRTSATMMAGAAAVIAAH